jgi:hypothetical protein
VYVTAYTIILNYQFFIIYNYASMNKTIRFKKTNHQITGPVSYTLQLHQLPGAEGRHEGGATAMSGQVRSGTDKTEKPDVPAPTEGHL